MPLKSSEVDSLLKVLSIELTENQTLETIANTYHSLLPTADSFQVCSALNFILTHLDDFAQAGSRRLVAEFLLYECYKNQPIVKNPFASVLLGLYSSQNSGKTVESTGKGHRTHTFSLSTPGADQLKGSTKELCEKEKQFLQMLLLDDSPKKDLVKFTPKQILQSDSVQTQIVDPLRNKLGPKALEITRQQFERNLPDRCKNLAISGVLPYPDEKR
jgi:hypothetical protein